MKGGGGGGGGSGHSMQWRATDASSEESLDDSAQLESQNLKPSTTYPLVPLPKSVLPSHYDLEVRNMKKKLIF